MLSLGPVTCASADGAVKAAFNVGIGEVGPSLSEGRGRARAGMASLGLGLGFKRKIARGSQEGEN